jgi:hypothetical protein
MPGHIPAAPDGIPSGVRSHGSSLPSVVRAKAQRDTAKCRQRLLSSSTTLASEFVTAVAAGSAA